MGLEREVIINMYYKQTFKGSSSVWTPEKDFYTFIKKHAKTRTIWEY